MYQEFLAQMGVGRYSYAFAIAYYFAIFAMLGVNNYGNRTIATVSGDKEKQSKTFWSIYLFQLFFAVISIVAYILYIIFYVMINCWDGLCWHMYFLQLLILTGFFWNGRI